MFCLWRCPEKCVTGTKKPTRFFENFGKLKCYKKENFVFMACSSLIYQTRTHWVAPLRSYGLGLYLKLLPDAQNIKKTAEEVDEQINRK